MERGGWGELNELFINQPMIYSAPYLMVLMRADPLQGHVGGGWALEILTLLGPVKWHVPGTSDQ